MQTAKCPDFSLNIRSRWYLIGSLCPRRTLTRRSKKFGDIETIEMWEPQKSWRWFIGASWWEQFVQSKLDESFKRCMLLITMFCLVDILTFSGSIYIFCGTCQVSSVKFVSRNLNFQYESKIKKWLFKTMKTCHKVNNFFLKAQCSLNWSKPLPALK